MQYNILLYLRGYCLLHHICLKKTKCDCDASVLCGVFPIDVGFFISNLYNIIMHNIILFRHIEKTTDIVHRASVQR